MVGQHGHNEDVTFYAYEGCRIKGVNETPAVGVHLVRQVIHGGIGRVGNVIDRPANTIPLIP